MKIYTLIRKGELHPIFCEDFQWNNRISPDYWVGTVMDGCSSGTESHFASALLGKIIQKSTKNFSFQSFLQKKPSLEAISKQILQMVFEEFVFIQTRLALSTNELLATLLLLVYHIPSQKAQITVVGDGVVCFNQMIYEIDQDNTPDYMAYHLNNDFETWFATLKNIFLIERPTDISISTDGITSYKTNKTDIPENFDVQHYLLQDNFLENNPNMLSRKYQILKTQYGYLPADDLSIIRIKF